MLAVGLFSSRNWKPTAIHNSDRTTPATTTAQSMPTERQKVIVRYMHEIERNRKKEILIKLPYEILKTA